MYIVNQNLRHCCLKAIQKHLQRFQKLDDAFYLMSTHMLHQSVYLKGPDLSSKVASLESDMKNLKSVKYVTFKMTRSSKASSVRIHIHI